MITPDLTDTPLHDLVSLDGKVAVVTGAAKGIGEAIASRFAQAGATVVIADIDAESADSTAGALRANGAQVDARALDVTDSEAVAEIARDVVANHGGLDIWVNNAGVYPSRPLLEMSDDDWKSVLDINLTGTFVGSREAARQMVDLGRPGVILNITSVSGYRGRKGLAHYSSSKHGIRGLTRSLAVELGPRGIRALALAPTMVMTPGAAAAATAPRPTDGGSHSTEIYAQLPLGRPGVPDDVARVALFCVSDLAAFMTGSTLAVDAGQMSM